MKVVTQIHQLQVCVCVFLCICDEMYDDGLQILNQMTWNSNTRNWAIIWSLHAKMNLTSPTFSKPLRAAISCAMSFSILRWNLTKNELVKTLLVDDATNVVSPRKIYNHTDNIAIAVKIFGNFKFFTCPVISTKLFSF